MRTNAAFAKPCVHCDDAADLLGDRLTACIVERHEVNRTAEASAPLTHLTLATLLLTAKCLFWRVCTVPAHRFLQRLELGIRISKEVFKLKSRTPADAAVSSQDCVGFPNDSTAASSALPQSEAGVNPTQLASLLRLHSKYKYIYKRRSTLQP
jgi:hypothetical protein